MNYLNISVLVVKIVFDVASRILLFSAWMYTSNAGQFSTWRTVVAYYSNLLILIIFNVIFTSNGNFLSIRNWIGNKYPTFQVSSILYISGIILNSMNSVLSFNNLDHLNSILYKKNEKTLADQQKHWHEPSFIKQFVYFFVLYVINAG